MWCWFGVFLHKALETSHLIEAFFTLVIFDYLFQKEEIAHPADELSCNFVADLTRRILTMLESLTVQFPWTKKLQQASGVLEAGP